MLGPDALKLIEILSERMRLEPGMKVLDMGCGKGLTSIFLAKEFGVTVFANDLWVSASENYKRFIAMGVEDRVFPIKAEAHTLPYADGFFDAAISVDAYHYFGTDETYFPCNYARLVKSGGQFGMLSPGLTKEFYPALPERMRSLWEPDMYAFHSAQWWASMWTKTGLVTDVAAESLPDGKALWSATADGDLHAADDEGYLTLVLMTATKA
ncbi:MAG: hypothetical protein A2Y38_04990 [Spirochaetes bacterium GWB1_59_5]|nr:MAG: hypothetical protein A2Y38_04990 [Spirochaetes bacterium GWB1_59_5]